MRLGGVEFLTPWIGKLILRISPTTVTLAMIIDIQINGRSVQM
jgi:hypothetical protein